MTEHDFLATTAAGLEPLLVGEMGELGLTVAAQENGRVAFRSDLAGAYRLCLWSRVASRVLLVLGRRAVESADALHAWLLELPWEEHIPTDGTLAVGAAGSAPGLDNSLYAAMRVKDAVVDRLRARCGQRPNVAKRRPDVQLRCLLSPAETLIAIDLTGEPLHRRGYRTNSATAPLRETLAAGILLRAGWPAIAASGDAALVDPMCGSGTLVIEAAWIAGDRAPGLERAYYGFQGWQGHQPQLWRPLIEEARERWRAGRGQIPALFGYDADDEAIRAARANARRAGVADCVAFAARSLSALANPAPGAEGLVVANPPYGERLGEQRQLQILYAHLGEKLKRQFPGWHAAVLAGGDEQLGELGLRAERRYLVYNGNLRCRLGLFRISPNADKAPPAAAELGNRLRKNLKHLRRWARREGVSCYRVYDADLPEYAMAVDVYQGESRTGVHVQEYQAPRSVDEGKARRRLHDALLAIPDALEVSAEALVVKTRRRAPGASRYRSEASARENAFVVNEGRARLWVDLESHLDTGLFLDHRPVRQWLADNAAGRRILNLFCYTGAATAHAALGGADASLSIDLSRTYLRWAERNLHLNGLDTQQHQLLRADVLKWLGEQSSARQRPAFDLIFLDPPTFSASKGMATTLDIQRDHPTLIRRAMRLLAEGGTLVFSTNARRFELDETLQGEYTVADATAWSIPEDFRRNSRIHRCFFITAGHGG